MRLQGKVALITGGGAGIGAATARIFAREGACVFLVDQDESALRRTVEGLRHAASMRADVADPDSARAAVAGAVEAFARLDILVNNAAMRKFAAVADASPEEWRSVLDVNLVGAAGYCKAALPALRQSGRGSIVNVSSCYALTGRKGMAAYDASKAALIALTRTLAHEEASRGVRANAVCPGSTLTEFHMARARAAGGSLEELREERRDNSLLGRWADPEEIALPILWLASDEASFVTGAVLPVDGGLAIL